MAPGKITNEAFETKTALGPNFKAGMGATITDELLATNSIETMVSFRE